MIAIPLNATSTKGSSADVSVIPRETAETVEPAGAGVGAG
jgi:hypothetical protein